jgi:GTPase SAR1 family protein
MPESISLASDELSKLNEWISRHIKPVAKEGHPLEWRRWMAEIGSIRECIERPQSIRIALVGTTGAGKSTLLNSLLGQQLLQVGVSTSITSFVTLVRYRAGSDYEVDIEYETLEEWAKGIERFLIAAEPGDEDGDGVAKSVINNMRKRIEAVHDVKLDDPSQYPQLHELPVTPEVQRIFEGPTHVKSRFPNAKSMEVFLRSVVNSKSSIWPLVKQVSISGPYDVLKGGIELVDLPGTNDLNEARVDVTRDFIRNSPFVWLVFSMKRGITADGRKLLEEEKILRTLVLSGSYNSLQVIGTHADDVKWTVAHQFGLDPDENTDAELVQAYRDYFTESSRKTLIELVEGLANDSDRGVTLQKMIDLASQAPIHAVSAEVYNHMTKLVRGAPHPGFDNVEETGIPGVLASLHAISNEVGAGLTSRTAMQRIEHLRSEVASFFRARAAAGNPVVARAKESLEEEVSRLRNRAAHAHTAALASLESKRKDFLNRMQPLFQSSVSGVKRQAADWAQINWATLRATVCRDGVFKSPSSGRLYDLNEDITDPLLDNLPVAWQTYFGTELGSIRDEFTLKLNGISEDFAHHANKLIRTTCGREDPMTVRQLANFRRRVEFDKEQCALKLSSEVAERRRALAFGMTRFAKEAMQPAYDKGRHERGPGMKLRILAALTPQAVNAAPKIFQTIEQDIRESLSALEDILGKLLEDLASACGEQAALVAHNVNLDLDTAQVPPELRNILDQIPAAAH